MCLHYPCYAVDGGESSVGAQARTTYLTEPLLYVVLLVGSVYSKC